LPFANYGSRPDPDRHLAQLGLLKPAEGDVEITSAAINADPIFSVPLAA
jgi:hypothetical protein